MSNNEQGAVHADSAGGISGILPAAGSLDYAVAPATSNERNAAVLHLNPIACWRVDDVRFAFDSSFVTPDIAAELQAMVSLREAHQKTSQTGGKPQYPPLSVFGHADPVGSDDYNKSLSGRRATAVYALLIANTLPDTSVGLWQEIAQAENWGNSQRRTMSATTGLAAGTPDSDLFKKYLQTVCPSQLQLGPQDFLAQGAGPGGKGDYQGCGEFNPVLIFSQSKQAQFEQTNNSAARNLANTQNRRVVVLLFRPGSKVNPQKWPCPGAREGTAGCIKRFWSDGEKRRSERLPSTDREFAATRDTFACRFYDRMSNNSPCETHSSFQLRLYDSDGNYIPKAPCRVTVEKRPPYDLNADAQGVIVVRDIKSPTNLLIEWGFAPKDGETADLEFMSNFQWLGAESVTTNTPASANNETDPNKTMLNNLGYTCAEAKLNIENFQRDYSDSEPTGQLDARTQKLLTAVYTTCADDLRQTPTSQA